MAWEIKDPSTVTNADKVLRLTKRVQELESELQQAKQWRRQAERSALLENMVKKEQDKSTVLQQQRDKLQEELEKAIADCRAKEKQIASAKKELADLRQRPTRDSYLHIKKELRTKEKELDNLLLKHENSTHKLAVVNKQLQAVNKKLDSALKEITSLRKRPTQGQYDSICNDLEKERNKVAALKSRPTQEQYNSVCDAVSHLQSKVQSLKSRPTQEQYDKQVSLAQYWEKQARDKARLATLCNELKQQVKELSGNIVKLEKRPTQKQYDNLKKELDSAKKDKGSREKVAILENKLKLAENEITELQRQVRTLSTRPSRQHLEKAQKQARDAHIWKARASRIKELEGQLARALEDKDKLLAKLQEPTIRRS